MPKVIQDFWILKDGIALYSRVFNPKVQDQLFAALMSALDSFANEISTGGLSNFELSDVRFTLTTRRGVIFVANADRKVKHKKVLDELMDISDKFFELYEKVLQNWDNDIDVFKDFGNHIEESLEVVIDKFKKAFW